MRKVTPFPLFPNKLFDRKILDLWLIEQHRRNSHLFPRCRNTGIEMPTSIMPLSLIVSGYVVASISLSNSRKGSYIAVLPFDKKFQQ